MFKLKFIHISNLILTQFERLKPTFEENNALKGNLKFHGNCVEKDFHSINILTRKCKFQSLLPSGNKSFSFNKEQPP